MRISARNQIKGTVVEVKKGATTSHVRVDIGNGQIITSSITNEAGDEVGIKAKGHVTVVVNAADGMIAVEEPSGCDKIKWNIDHARALLTAPDRTKLNSGSELAALPATAVTIALV